MKSVSAFFSAAALAVVFALASCATPMDLIDSIDRKDASSVADGDWEGSWSYFPNTAKVRVSVQSGRMTWIDLLDYFSNPDHSGKDILPRILEKQSLDVDVISGATRRTALAKSG